MPPVGVSVTRAVLDGSDFPGPTGARVDLLGKPAFENRNTVLTFAGREPIVPFHLRISTVDTRLEREMRMWPQDSQEPQDSPVHRIPRSQLEKFGARVFRTAPELIRAATGIDDPLADRVARHHRLVDDLAHETDPIRRAGTQKRIRELEIGLADPGNERVVNMTAVEEFHFPLTGKAVADGGLLEGLLLDTKARWAVEFWMGGWDADVMCGDVKGSLTVPLKPSG